MTRAALVVVLLLGLAPAATRADRQTSAPRQQQTQPPVDVSELPIDLDRIQTRLAEPRDINLDLLRPTFRTSVIETRPRWFDEIDWLEQTRGMPTPTGPAWHNEFLNMVTPEQAQLYQAYDSTELVQIAATSLLEALAANTVTNAIKTAVKNRKEAAAKREVDEAIEQWKREHGQTATPTP